MDKARQVLAQGVPPGDKAQSQQYLTPWEESALVKFILQMLDLGRPVRIKYIPSLAFVATCGRPATDRPSKPPGKNWAKTFEKRHPGDSSETRHGARLEPPGEQHRRQDDILV
ncbi:hypothetical protein P3342_007539 [Pyrenophora teres f. teres]|nr:hypothetical protein P3342_007539 [Pyrenophora teres f. teres]